MEYILKTDTRADEPALFSTDKESASEYIKKIYNSEIEKIKITGDRILEKWLSDEEGHIVLGNTRNDKIEIKLMTPKKMQQFMIPFRFTVEFQAIEEYETFEEALKFAQKNIEGYKRKVKSFLDDTNLKLVDKSFGIDMNRVKEADFEYDERDFNSSFNQNKKINLENKNVSKEISSKTATQPSIPDKLHKFDDSNDNNDKNISSNISSSEHFNNLINNSKNKLSDNSNKMIQPSFSNSSSTTDSQKSKNLKNPKINKSFNTNNTDKTSHSNDEKNETPNTVYGTFDKFDKFNNLDAFVKDEERKSLNKRLNTENLEKNLEKNRESKINSTIDRSFNTKRFEFDDSTLQKNQAKENKEKDKKNKENKKDKVSKEKINNAKLDNDDFETTIIKPIFYMDDEFEKLKEDVNSTSDKTMIFKKAKKPIESSDELIGDDELYLTYLDKQKAEEKEEREEKKKKKRKLFGRK